jgi:hypothetical protein
MRIFAGLWLCFSTVVAQDFRASISGLVTDLSGTPVPAASVVVTSVERNVPAEAVTTEAGRYVVQFLLPGTYMLTVEKQGFKKVVREGIRLAASDRASLNVSLELGTVSDSVTVSGDAPLLSTESASRTALIEKQFIDNMPTSGRQLYQLQYSQPGGFGLFAGVKQGLPLFPSALPSHRHARFYADTFVRGSVFRHGLLGTC